LDTAAGTVCDYIGGIIGYLTPPYSSMQFAIFRRVRIIAKSDYAIRHVCPSGKNSAPTGRIFMKFDI